MLVPVPLRYRARTPAKFKNRCGFIALAAAVRWASNIYIIGGIGTAAVNVIIIITNTADASCYDVDAVDDVVVVVVWRRNTFWALLGLAVLLRF